MPDQNNARRDNLRSMGFSSPFDQPEGQSEQAKKQQQERSYNCIAISTPEEGLLAITRPLPSDETDALLDACRETWQGQFGEGCHMEKISETLGTAIAMELLSKDARSQALTVDVDGYSDEPIIVAVEVPGGTGGITAEA